MNKLTPFLALVVLSYTGTAHADAGNFNTPNFGTGIYITYTNKANVPLNFFLDPSGMTGFNQRSIPTNITVKAGQSVGPFYGEAQFTSGTYSMPLPSFTLMIQYNNGPDVSVCEVVNDTQSNEYWPSNCPPQITVSNDPKNNRSEIVVGPFMQTSLVKMNHLNNAKMTTRPHTLSRPEVTHSRMNSPHPLKEIEHYNTSKVNLMMRDRKTGTPHLKKVMIEHKPEVHKIIPEPQRLKK